MKRIFLISSFTLLLGACSHVPVYQPAIQQGNIITSAKIQKLHQGMSKSQVIRVMGQPILKNTIHPGQLFYVYTFQQGREKAIQKHVILSFKNHRLSKIQQF